MRVAQTADDGSRAVSPVIGVVLLVAITVILAAVIATFVLGLTAGQETTPTAVFEVEQTTEGSGGQPDELAVTLTQGGPVDASRLSLSFETVQIQESAGGGTPGPADTVTWEAFSGDDTVAAGDRISPVEPEDSNPQVEGRTLRLVYEGESGSSVIYEWDAPDD